MNEELFSTRQDRLRLAGLLRFEREQHAFDMEYFEQVSQQQLDPSVEAAMLEELAMSDHPMRAETAEVVGRVIVGDAVAAQILGCEQDIVRRRLAQEKIALEQNGHISTEALRDYIFRRIQLTLDTRRDFER